MRLYRETFGDAAGFGIQEMIEDILVE